MIKVKKQKISLIVMFTLVTAVSATAMTQAYAQSTADGMDGYVRGTSGIYTGNPNECWYPDEDGNMLPCRIDTGDTAWMLTASSLVLLMSPGVAVFYGGLARSKNSVNVFGMVLVIMGVAAVQWLAFGYSLTFGPNDGPGNAFLGSFDYAGFNNVSHYAPLGAVGSCTDTWSAAYQMNEMVDADQCSQDWPGTIPHMLFAIFQGTFAIITPILIIGAVVDRMKFSAVLIFVIIWSTFVYYPVAHWIWGGGFMADGTLDLDPSLSPSYVLDFAGGAVVHITAGFAALAAALVLGRRMGLGKVPMEPHNIPMVVLGASILWFGWFGFNPGSEVMVDGITISAWMTTNIAAGMGTVSPYWKTKYHWCRYWNYCWIGNYYSCIWLGRSNGCIDYWNSCWLCMLWSSSIQECQEMG
jgi:Amt family ammonium transporter